LIFAAAPALAQRTAALPAGRVIDLSYPFDQNTVYWPTAEAFKLETDFEGVTDKGYFYSAYRYSAAEHGGTHPTRLSTSRRDTTPSIGFRWHN
jgi:hypothetical protein